MKSGHVLALVTVAFVTAHPRTSAEEPGIPARAIHAMSFYIGDWEADHYADGEHIRTSVDRRLWAPGEHCVTMEWLGLERGASWRAAAVAGWDAREKALIEYWHGSQGQSLVVRFPLEKMTDRVWDGHARFTEGDGTVTQGECRLTKTPDGFEYVHRTTQNGNETVLKIVARRVTTDKTASLLGQPCDASAERTNIPEKALAAMSYFVGSWEGEDITDGRSLGTNRDRRFWVPGQYCFKVDWSGTHDGTPARFFGISGWDAAARALVEHWFSSRGEALTTCYPVDEMRDTVWDGTFAFVTKDGTWSEGRCQFTADPNEGAWIGRSTQNDQEVVFKSVARKVQAAPATDLAEQSGPERADAPRADDYVNYVRAYFPGVWRTELIASDGTIVAQGTTEFQMEPEQRSAVSFGRGDDPAMVSHAIHGYDPGTRSWRLLQFTGDGTMVEMAVHIDRQVLVSGKYENVNYKHRNTLTKPDGTREVSEWQATIVNRNTFELRQITGPEQERITLRFTRQ
jgi:hypothetical protein